MKKSELKSLIKEVIEESKNNQTSNKINDVKRKLRSLSKDQLVDMFNDIDTGKLANLLISIVKDTDVVDGWIPLVDNLSPKTLKFIDVVLADDYGDDYDKNIESKKIR